MRFRVGDRVEVKGFLGVLILDSIDERLTSMLGRVHWNTLTEDYLLGKRKVNNGESYCEDELTLL